MSLIQPTEGVEAKPKLRKPAPPKQEVKAESFQGFQLKPVAKGLKKPQNAENGTVELKVSRKSGTFKIHPISSVILSTKLQSDFLSISLMCLLPNFYFLSTLRFEKLFYSVLALLNFPTPLVSHQSICI